MDAVCGLPRALGISTNAAGAAALGFAFVVLPGAFEGAYFAGSWVWMTLALASVAGLALVLREQVVVSWAEVAVLASLGALACWQLLSTYWAVAGATSVQEARRTLLYLVAVAAVLLCVHATSVRFLLGGICAGTVVLSLYALGERALGLEPPALAFESAALAGSLGYSNALAALAAFGAILALGLSASSRTRTSQRAYAAATVVLVVTLALAESTGAWLALGVGLGVGLLAAEPAFREALLSRMLVCVPAAATGVVLAKMSAGAWLLAALAPALVVCLARSPVRPRWLLPAGIGVAGILLAALVVGSMRVSYSLGNRGEYWRVAVEDATSHPVLGSGAGSYASVWQSEERAAGGTRNAHNVYLETLAELGPLGLALLAVVAVLPIAVSLRSRRLEVVPVALAVYAAFLFHSGLDWDWQIPAVVLPALAVAATLLIVARPRSAGTAPKLPVSAPWL